MTTPRKPLPRWLTVAEVARHLRVSKMTVYRRVKDKSLKGLYVGRTVRIREDHVFEYIRKNSTADS